jgi:hypothetical protein
LLRNLKIDRPNQVWAMDISYIPMARGFVYLAAVVDWFSPQDPELETVDHDGLVVLRRGGRAGPGRARQAGDLQHRPREPIHERGLHGTAEEK